MLPRAANLRRRQQLRHRPPQRPRQTVRRKAVDGDGAKEAVEEGAPGS